MDEHTRHLSYLNSFKGQKWQRCTWGLKTHIEVKYLKKAQKIRDEMWNRTESCV